MLESVENILCKINSFGFNLFFIQLLFLYHYLFFLFRFPFFQSLVSKVRHLLSSLQIAEVNLQQTLSPPAGNHGDRTTQEVVGGVDHAHQQRQCRELQQECRKYDQ